LRDLDLFYVLTGFLMFGPDSTQETLKANIDFLHKYSFTDNVNFISNVLMLIRDSELYNMLMEEGRVIETKNHWELPKYKIKDPLSARVTKQWENLFARFPFTKEVSALQTNIGNLVSRITNPMNRKALELLKHEYSEFKSNFNKLNNEMRSINYDYFNSVIDLVAKDCSDDKLAVIAHDLFEKTYKQYLFLYNGLYNQFYDKIVKSGVSLSGLIFRHFLSTMAVEKTKRAEKEVA